MGLRVAGSIEVKTDGSILEAKGQWLTTSVIRSASRYTAQT